jgi:hypothetical protein
MNEATTAMGILGGLTIAGGLVLAVLGGVLRLVDRRFDDPPELAAGPKLMRVGLILMVAGAVVVTAVVLTS